VPQGTSKAEAFSLFCSAAGDVMGYRDRHFSIVKTHREYESDFGGQYEVYLMASDRSGHVYGRVFLTFLLTEFPCAKQPTERTIQ
jgi:hypothetical protein